MGEEDVPPIHERHIEAVLLLFRAEDGEVAYRLREIPPLAVLRVALGGGAVDPERDPGHARTRQAPRAILGERQPASAGVSECVRGARLELLDHVPRRLLQES